jgi:hypothetical protein
MLTIKNPRKDVHQFEFGEYKLVDGGLTSNDGSGNYDNSDERLYYEWSWYHTDDDVKFMVFLNREPVDGKYLVRIRQSKHLPEIIHETSIPLRWISDSQAFYNWMIVKIETYKFNGIAKIIL